MGTDCQVVRLLGKGPGTPKSRLCGLTIMEAWVSWAGWPRHVRVDRGMHNRGYFAIMLGAHGICPFSAGLESPEQIGNTERHGGIWQRPATRVIHRSESLMTYTTYTVTVGS